MSFETVILPLRLELLLSSTSKRISGRFWKVGGGALGMAHHRLPSLRLMSRAMKVPSVEGRD